MTTTFKLIRNQVHTVLTALTPALISGSPFRRADNKRLPLREWALANASSAIFRSFDYRVTGPEEMLPYFGTSEREVRVEATLTVAYPVLVGLYGIEDLDSMEDVIESDAQQIWDEVFTPDNYASGQNLAEVIRTSPDRADPKCYLQEFVIANSFYRAMSL